MVGRTVALVLVAACLLSGSLTARAEQQPVLTAFSSVTVGVADLDEALALWRDVFGFEVVAIREGEDSELASLWGLNADDIARQALLRTPPLEIAQLHLVQFNHPGEPVRAGANVFDLCPKNLDIYVDDMPKRVAELKAAGVRFRNENFSEVTTPNGTRFRELHMPGHDDINIVLLQVIGQSHEYTDKGFAGIGPLISIVGDSAAERAFFRDGFGMTLLHDNLLEGPEIEEMVGLPPGAALDVSIWGAAGQHFGQMEIIDYQGVDSDNRYPRARPKSLGTLHISYQRDDLEPLLKSLAAAGIEPEARQRADTMIGTGDVITLRTPVGLRIDVFGQLPD